MSGTTAQREEAFDDEEEAMPRRRPAAAERREPLKTEPVSERTDVPERPARPMKQNVEDMEKDLSKNLAMEAAKAAPKAAQAAKTEKEDDDLEFIDLDL